MPPVPVEDDVPPVDVVAGLPPVAVIPVEPPAAVEDEAAAPVAADPVAAAPVAPVAADPVAADPVAAVGCVAGLPAEPLPDEVLVIGGPGDTSVTAGFAQPMAARAQTIDALTLFMFLLH
jgi:hypothetical protein